MSSPNNPPPNNPPDEMNQLLTFINNRIKMLCDIYLNERQSKGDGILFFTITNIEPNTPREVKLFYQIDNELQPSVLNDLQNRRNHNTTNIIYFYLFTDDGKQNIVELDIRDHINN